MKKKLNLVYDNWDNENNCPLTPNCNELYNSDVEIFINTAINTFDLNENDIKHFNINEIVNYPNTPFYYFVTTMPNKIVTNHIEGVDILPKLIVDYWREYPNLNIVFINTYEIESIDVLTTLNSWTHESKLNQKQLWLINNETKLKYYKDLIKTDINVHSSKRMKSFTSNFLTKAFNDIQYITDKPDFFMCYNKRSKPHRFGLLSILKNNNILDDINWSSIEKYNLIDDYYLTEIFNLQDVENMTSAIDFLSELETKKSKYEEDNNWDIDNVDRLVNWDSKWNNVSAYENSYFNIVTESEFASENIHITEKSFKPFFCMQFPLILATPNHIKELKNDYDLDFFDDIINHDYDKELNHRDRLFKFTEEIKRINENKDFFIDFYKNNKERFINNHKKIIDTKNDTHDKKLIQNLIYKKIEKPKGLLFIDNLKINTFKKTKEEINHINHNSYINNITNYFDTYNITVSENISNFKYFINNHTHIDTHKIEMSNIHKVVIITPDPKKAYFDFNYNNTSLVYDIKNKTNKTYFYKWILEIEKISMKDWYNKHLIPQLFKKIKSIILHYKNMNIDTILLCETDDFIHIIENDVDINNNFVTLNNNYKCINELQIDNELLLNDIISENIIENIKREKVKKSTKLI